MAWQAEVNNYYQSLTIDLNGRFNICAVATRGGRKGTKEFVSEYYVLSSDDGQNWATYQSDGGDQVFFGRMSLVFVLCGAVWFNFWLGL